MQKAAVEKAKDRLESAKDHLGKLESSKSYEGARRCWYDFLIASNAVFSLLEQGSKGSGSSQKWFRNHKQTRNGDPLLCYLHHSRNADEHNVASVTKLDRQKMVLVEDGEPTAAIEEITGNAGKFRSLDGKTPDLKKVTEIRIYPDRAKLITVTDRGQTYEPPSEHMGERVDDRGPISVARLMVRYVEEMIDESEVLARQL